MPWKVADPLIELLAIKLYEHSSLADGSTVLRSLATGRGMSGWLAMDDEDRQMFRDMAAGRTELAE